MTQEQSRELPSLIATDDRQPVLFSDFGEAGEQAEKSLTDSREHTGGNLWSSDPDRYRLVVELLGRGMSQRIIAKVCRVSHNTVRAVARREGDNVDTLKGRISLQLKQFAALAVERLLDEGHEIPLNQLAVAMGIAIDKAQLLDGEPTSITAAAGKTVADFEEAFDALPSAKGKVIDAEEITGFRGEELPQRGSADSRPVDGGDAESGGLDGLPGDADEIEQEGATGD